MMHLTLGISGSGPMLPLTPSASSGTFCELMPASKSRETASSSDDDLRKGGGSR